MWASGSEGIAVLVEEGSGEAVGESSFPVNATPAGGSKAGEDAKADASSYDF